MQSNELLKYRIGPTWMKNSSGKLVLTEAKRRIKKLKAYYRDSKSKTAAPPKERHA